MILWRPVGMREMELIIESGMSAFPPRLSGQPLFYPVLNEGYAARIAREWNTHADPFVGYVTRFTIPGSYGSKFERHIVGAREHEELWVPADDLEMFNAMIEGPIEVISAYFGRGFQGYIPSCLGLREMNADRQIQTLASIWDYNKVDFLMETRGNELAVFLNFPFWLASSPSELGIAPEVLASVLDGIRHAWPLFERVGPLIEHGGIVD